MAKPKPVYLPTQAEIAAACLEIRSGKRKLKPDTRRSEKREKLQAIERQKALATALSCVRLTGQARADLLEEAAAQFEGDQERAKCDADRLRRDHAKVYNVAR